MATAPLSGSTARAVTAFTVRSAKTGAAPSFAIDSACTFWPCTATSQGCVAPIEACSKVTGGVPGTFSHVADAGSQWATAEGPPGQGRLKARVSRVKYPMPVVRPSSPPCVSSKRSAAKSRNVARGARPGAVVETFHTFVDIRKSE